MGTDYLPAYITEELKRIDRERFTDELIGGGGLRVYTSINYDMQRAAWQAVTSTLSVPDDPATPEWDGDPEASLVAVDDQGLIRAMVGSRHQYTPEGDHQENYAVRGNGSEGREPGSTFKPIVLAEAMKESYSLRSRYNAQGTVEFPDIRTDGKPWKVSNYSESDAGVLDLIEATRESSNTAYAQLMHDLGLEQVDPEGDGTSVYEGPAKVAQLAEQMGVGGEEGIPDDQTVPAMVLGTVNATPLEMAGVYSTFANRGYYKEPSIITRVEQVGQDGKAVVLYERQVNQVQVLTEAQADLVTHALQGVVQEGGTGEAANIGRPAAGKTGTSQQNRNAWFAGFVPKLTAVVWMGYPNPDWTNPETGKLELKPMNRDGLLVQGRVATGGSFPAQIWKKFMEFATAGTEDQFTALTPQQIAQGEVIHEDDLRTKDEQATTVPEDPRWTVPDFTIPEGGPGGGPGGGGTTITRPRDTTTTAPPVTTATTAPPSTVSIPGGGGGGPPTGPGG
jgi:penicillin-binding protein 1A